MHSETDVSLHTMKEKLTLIICLFVLSGLAAFPRSSAEIDRYKAVFDRYRQARRLPRAHPGLLRRAARRRWRLVQSLQLSRLELVGFQLRCRMGLDEHTHRLDTKLDCRHAGNEADEHFLLGTDARKEKKMDTKKYTREQTFKPKFLQEKAINAIFATSKPQKTSNH